jgi:hypothetical protein
MNHPGPIQPAQRAIDPVVTQGQELKEAPRLGCFMIVARIGAAVSSGVRKELGELF